MEPQRPPRRLWQRWIVANAWAEALGLSIVAGVGFVVARRLGEPGGPAAALGLAAVFVALGAIEGLVVGVAQSRVLRSALPQLTGWVSATVVGAMVSWALGMVPSTIMSSLPQEPAAAPPELGTSLRLVFAAGLGALAGPMLAAFQWRRLREVLPHAGWWLPANALAWACAMPVIFLAAHLAASESRPLAAAVELVLAFVLAGALVGAIHGRFLLWLLARRAQRAA